MNKKVITGILFIIIIMTSCASTQQNITADAISIFWNYISENENKIFSADLKDQAKHDEIFNSLNNQVQLINKNLYVILGNEIIDNKRDFIISSGGDSEYFNLCDKIIRKAPIFTYLNTISLLPPIDNIDIYGIGDLVLNMEDISVHFDGKEKYDLLFILSNNHLSRINSDKSGELYSVYMRALYLMTMQYLGERAFTLKISSASIAPLPVIIAPLVPFKELRNYIFINIPTKNSIDNINPEEYLPISNITALPVFNTKQIIDDLDYPKEALKKGIEGRVILELFIDKEGIIQYVHILREEPEGYEFGESAIKSLFGRQVTPAYKNGEPVSVRYRFPVTFRIK